MSTIVDSGIIHVQKIFIIWDLSSNVISKIIVEFLCLQSFSALVWWRFLLMKNVVLVKMYTVITGPANPAEGPHFFVEKQVKKEEYLHLGGASSKTGANTPHFENGFAGSVIETDSSKSSLKSLSGRHLNFE